MEDEIKQITKLSKKEKFKIVLIILLVILETIAAFNTKNYVWILVAMMWVLVIIMEICHIKIMKLKDDLIKKQDDFIETITNELKKINKENYMRKFEYVNRFLSNGYETLQPNFSLPVRSTKNSGGYDFFAMEDITLEPHKITYVPTGVKCKMLDDEILILANRSSNPKKKGIILASGINIIDADYYGNPDNDGEISLILQNITDEPVIIKKGDKTVQAVFIKFLKTDDDNSEKERVSGIGSTGR